LAYREDLGRIGQKPAKQGLEVFLQPKVEGDRLGHRTVILVVPGVVVGAYPQRKVASVGEPDRSSGVEQRFHSHSPEEDEQREKNCRTEFAPQGVEGGKSLPLVSKRSKGEESSHWLQAQ
jgi:hypothetical protein